MDVVGEVIAFWGFKHNHGRIWALLYLRDASLTAAELQEILDLSKGAVSMLTRDLEEWEIIHHDLEPATGTRRYAANTDMMRMIARVIHRREAGIIHQAYAALQAAEAEAAAAGASPETLERIRRMRQLAEFMDQALGVFTRTARLDLRRLVGALRSPAQLLRWRSTP